MTDLDAAVLSWGWLLCRLGWQTEDSWPAGRSWRLGDTYLVVESGRDVLPVRHERTRPGLNHLAFHAGPREQLDAVVSESTTYGWTLLFTDRHPYAGGPAHYAAYLEDTSGFEVELVSDVDTGDSNDTGDSSGQAEPGSL